MGGEKREKRGRGRREEGGGGGEEREGRSEKGKCVEEGSKKAESFQTENETMCLYIHRECEWSGAYTES